MRKIAISERDTVAVVDAGSAPMLQWIDIDRLVVDDDYQRDLRADNWKTIRRIARHFRWSMFSPVFVAPVEGGAYAVIDGQHRTHAAAMCGFTQVPCQVVQMSRAEQAAAFAAVNGRVTKVTSWQILRASIAAGEEWAVTADRIAREGGCRLMTRNSTASHKRPREIYAVRGFVSLVGQRRASALVAALKALTEAEGYGDVAAIWDGKLLIPLIAALSERPKALLQPAFRKSFEEFDIWGLIDREQEDRRRKARTGAPTPPLSDVLRAGILEWIDKAFPERVALPTHAGEVV